jgi:hypothetical protein
MNKRTFMRRGLYGLLLAAFSSFSNGAKADVASWQKALDALFVDKACTELKADYANCTMAELKENANYKALPAALQKMVLKMATDGTWAEDNAIGSKPAWDAEYAKRLRVQLIEPYNDKEAAAGALNMNSHTNLNNPMGIYGDAGQTLYIMVEGEIKDGSTLYLPIWTGHNKPGNDYREGVQLKEGLNTVSILDNNSTGCFNYVVQTFDTSKGKGSSARSRKLSDYEDLKIHVEGGYVNGFFNYVGDALWGEGDNNADWDYYAARANQTDLIVMGKYMVLQFPLFKSEVTENNPGLDHYFTGKNIATDVIQAWDNVMLSQRMLMGLASKEDVAAKNLSVQSPYSTTGEVFAFTGDDPKNEFPCDYADYYNVHGLAYGVGGSTYMYGSWDHSGYNFNTMGSIMSDIVTHAGSFWGPAHEIGHQHQSPFTLNGLMEVTNNLFSNVALWYFGKSTSRYNGDQGSLTNVYNAFIQPGGDFYTNNIWALTHMYYKLFLYYHVLGHNTKFYPRLYEMLRHDPMVRGYQQDGEVGLLHFYKKACMAAGEDLTEFFRAYGILTVMTDRFVGDYSNSIYNTTQQQIDDAIAEVKALGYKENLAAIYVNDGTKQTIKSHRGGNLEFFDGSTYCAEVGSYAYFDEPATEGKYSYSSSTKKLSITATGGVGYAIRNSKGELLGFSDYKKFDLSGKAALAIMQDDAKVEVVNGDNTFVECEQSKTVKRYLLSSLIAEVKEMLQVVDATNTKVGYYREQLMDDLKTARDTAQAVHTKSQDERYVEVYVKLYNEMEKIKNNPNAVNVIIPNSSYLITNVKASNIALTVTASNMLTGATKNADNDAQQWILEPAGADDTYYLKNKATSFYLDEIPDGKQGSATATSPASAYRIVYLGEGQMALQCTTGKEKSLNYNSGIGVLGWDYNGDTGSWWKITAVELNQAELDRIELETLIGDTRTLLEQMGENVILPGKMSLQVENPDANFYLSCNADQNVVGTAKDGGGVAALLDGKTSTYLHTQWNGTAVKSDHYLQVEMGDELSIDDFKFTYATREASEAFYSSPAPTVLKVYTSLNGTSYNKLLGTYKSSGVNKLPSYTELGAYWTSPKISSTSPIRYLRFIVTSSAGPGSNQYGGHCFFAMSEFSISTTKTYVGSLKADYVGNEGLYTETADEMYASTLVKENAESTDEEIANALAALQAKYNELLAVFKTNTGITTVAPENAQKAQGIYDVTGRKVNEITQPGLYIINGKKHYVK